MATVYKVELTSHWVSYSIEELKKILEDTLRKTEKEKGNTISVEVSEKR